MTNTFAKDVARWLATNPGLFQGPSREAVLGRAYAACPVCAPKEDRAEQIEHFGRTLKMLGHDARYITEFDAAGEPVPNRGHWQLPLPEKPHTGPSLEQERDGNFRRG